MQAGLDTIDFGSGPVQFASGHFAVQRGVLIGIVAIHGDVGARVPVTRSGLRRLADSPILPALAPASRLCTGGISC